MINLLKIKIMIVNIFKCDFNHLVLKLNKYIYFIIQTYQDSKQTF